MGRMETEPNASLVVPMWQRLEVTAPEDPEGLCRDRPAQRRFDAKPLETQVRAAVVRQLRVRADPEKRGRLRPHPLERTSGAGAHSTSVVAGLELALPSGSEHPEERRAQGIGNSGD